MIIGAVILSALRRLRRLLGQKYPAVLNPAKLGQSNDWQLVLRTVLPRFWRAPLCSLRG